MGYAYLSKGLFECVCPIGGYHTLEPYTMFMGPFCDIWQCLWDPGSSHAFEISCSAKVFNMLLPSNVYAGWLCLVCLM